MFEKSIVAVLLIFGTVHVFAISKCKGSDGKVTFQDADCPGQGEKISVKPASGLGDPAKITAQTAMQMSLTSLQNERIGREKWVVLNDARNALEVQRNQCADVQKQLAESKSFSKNNLAGATRDVAISQEMTATAIACDSRSRVKEKEVADAEKICSEVKCIRVF